MSVNGKESAEAVSFATLLVALGIIYGDIGTSPLYVLKAVIGVEPITPELVLGALSCIFWTLTILTTIKYVWLILQADNKGEGGIFSLFALTRRQAKWLIFPAIIGGSALLADGIITPPISVASAVEGLRIIYPKIPTVPIVLVIIIALFSVQHFGTKAVGKSFGPVMFVWFSMLAILGGIQLGGNMEVLRAINPLFGFELLFRHPHGFWALGAIFLCTTGAEALYSDLGHCGRANIRISWIFVKTCLLLNYFGQGAWLLSHEGQILGDRNPFYLAMPPWFLMFGIAIATAAAIIASQALISGSFTLAAEAIRLYFFPKSRIVYPTEVRGQIYVPALNFLLLTGCIGVVLYFKESSNMEAAYGLSITVTMLMTTLLFSHYLRLKRTSPILIALFLVIYVPIELSFLASNLSKFMHGGYVTVLIGGLLFTSMWAWNQGTRLKRRYTEYVALDDHLDAIEALSNDETIPKFSTHLVYLTGAPVAEMIESKIIYSIFRKRPKKADVYWFIHVDVVDDPYTTEYEVIPLIPGKVFRIDFSLGFRMEPRINVLFRQALEDLSQKGEVDILSRYESLRRNNIPGDFRFVVLEKTLSAENDLPTYERLIMLGYGFLKRFALSEERGFGLDTSAVMTEKVPLVISAPRSYDLKRVHQELE